MKIKKEGLLKRLKDIEDKIEELLKVKNKSENIKEVTGFIDQPLSFEAKKLIEEIRVLQKGVQYRKLKIRGSNKSDYDFSYYKTFKELFKELYYKKNTIEEVEGKQYEFDTIINSLEDYTPRNNKYVEAKNKLSNNAINFCNGREKIIEEFKNEILQFIRIKWMSTERNSKEKKKKKKKKK